MNRDPETLSLQPLISRICTGTVVLCVAALAFAGYSEVKTERSGVDMPQGTEDLAEGKYSSSHKVPSAKLDQADCGKINRPLQSDTEIKKVVVDEVGKFTIINCEVEAQRASIS